jgi:membrane protein implicated in regulation of membrane protease activity
MRDRDLAPAALVAAFVCCGVTALVAGLVGAVALAAIGRFTMVSVAGLGMVVAIAWWLDRRRHRHDHTGDTSDRSTRPEGALR